MRLILPLAFFAWTPFVIAADLPPPAARKVEYERDVRPILAKHCYSCHGPDKQRGGLRLDAKTPALAGGDSGKVIVPHDSAKSVLIQLVHGSDAERIMPPKGERLTAEQIGILRKWIDTGATWPANANDEDDPKNWWSLKPLKKPAVPDVPQEWAKRVRNPIDAFVLAKLKEKELAPSPEADRRTLIRRLSYDLIGLPPTIEEIRAFEKDDKPDAYERLVDRLLASNQYGERWARHWLDVVHYGDTHGYDKDKPRPNAWPYRDYIIRSLNADKSYAKFVQEQIAGDVLFPGTVDGIVALGFIAAGPWDFIGHAEVSESKTDGKIARHLDRDDMVANTTQTFLSLTVQCAQCHNHKFDPIRQEEYYQFQAVFAALDRADRPYDTDPALLARAENRKASILANEAKAQQLQGEITRLGGAELKALDAKIAAAKSTPRPAEHGYHSTISMKQDDVKWVQLDFGKSVSLEKIALWGCYDDFNKIGAGFGFPLRFKVELSDDADFQKGVQLIEDHTKADFANPGIVANPFATGGKSGRFLRITATKLAPRQNDYIFALAECEAFDVEGKNLARSVKITARDSIEAPIRWRKNNLVDGLAPGMNSSGNLVELQKQREGLVAKVMSAEKRNELHALNAAIEQGKTELAQLKPKGMVYAGTVHTGSGTFRGTGPEGKPRPIHLLKRGNVSDPLHEVEPGALALIDGLPGSLPLPKNHTEGERRAALARWLTDARNPLPWRSIVNRVWQYHFGQGIVGTANDFGRMGQLPTHPELLEWLAADFRDNGMSLKKLHKLIVTSSTYRQTSASQQQYEKVDGSNAYLWRMNRHKLEAEAIRDAMLSVAGKLDSTMYGPAFQDFVIEQPAHSPHYQYHLFDPEDQKGHRRSIYRFLVRSKPQPFMTVLDCADPSMQVDKRNETLSPLQALAMLNNGFVLTMAKALAQRVEKAGALPAQVNEAFQLALGRNPNTKERDALVAYAQQHGLANACRVIFNLNEFVFAD